MSALGRVSSTRSSTTLVTSTSASGEVAGAFISVRMVGRKLSSTTSWCALKKGQRFAPRVNNPPFPLRGVWVAGGDARHLLSLA